MSFILTSPAFEHNAPMPRQVAHTRYGPGALNESPELTWQGAPHGTKSYALILSDPDAVSGTFTHWVVYNIPADAHGLPAHVTDNVLFNNDLKGTLRGRNDYGMRGYGGPNPPVGTGIHRYVFTLYALNTMINLNPESTTGPELEKAVENVKLAQATLIGLLGADTSNR